MRYADVKGNPSTLSLTAALTLLRREAAFDGGPTVVEPCLLLVAQRRIEVYIEPGARGEHIADSSGRGYRELAGLGVYFPGDTHHNLQIFDHLQLSRFGRPRGYAISQATWVDHGPFMRNGSFWR